jgi:hypothetical protein
VLYQSHSLQSAQNVRYIIITIIRYPIFRLLIANPVFYQRSVDPSMTHLKSRRRYYPPIGAVPSAKFITSSTNEIIPGVEKRCPLYDGLNTRGHRSSCPLFAKTSSPSTLPPFTVFYCNPLKFHADSSLPPRSMSEPISSSGAGWDKTLILETLNSTLSENFNFTGPRITPT